jgi:predicted nicotinamide N-methyase
MPETDAEAVGEIVVDQVTLGAHTLRMAKPKEPGRLLDLESVAQAYDRDQYMPYWAALWPVAKHLGREILSVPWKPGLRAIELGCGLALPGLAAAKAGMAVTFSDYDATALRFAERSAQLNGITDYRLLTLDWRDPPPERYDVIIGSDLTYEERNVAPLVALFVAMLAEGGLIMLADQDRKYAGLLTETLGAHGFVWRAVSFPATPDAGYEVAGTVYWIRRA